MKLFRTGVMAVLLAALVFITPFAAGQQGPPANRQPYLASQYSQWRATISVGTSASGAATLTVNPGIVNLPGGTSIQPFNVNAPINVYDATTDTVTPTVVSGCASGALLDSCQITATYGAAHGKGITIGSGTHGVAEAINDAVANGGGVVVVDALSGATDADIVAAPVYSKVIIQDTRAGFQTWTPSQATASVLAAPTTLVAATAGFGVNGANFTAGAYTGSSTYIACIAYVDIMGNEGPCSATFTIVTSGSAATDQIGFTAPAASTGAIGYTIYIDLASGTYNLTYQVPLTSTVCTLTKLETITPACAVANTAYGQSGSGAVVSALTVNTAPLHLLATTASTTSAYIGTPSGRTSYVYAPHNINTSSGFTASQLIYAISPAPGSTVPTVIGTFPVPVGFMNQVGRTIKLCGEATNAGTNSATVENIEILWDAAGSDTAGAPVIVGQMQITATQAGTVENYSFCETFQTTVAGAGVTAGSLIPAFGNFTLSEAAGTLHAAGPDVKAAAVGSLNLAGTGGNTQRIHVVYLHTTGTDGAGTTLQGLTVEVL